MRQASITMSWLADRNATLRLQVYNVFNALYYGLPGPGLYGRPFTLLKFRTMTVGADRTGGTSTAKSDRRVTRLGSVLRRWKLDELPQLANVVAGQMSLVGPRPNTRAGGVDRYGPDEMGLLIIAPGITDVASIVFADEADILDGAADADAAYDRLIRPWKSRLGLLYIQRATWSSDMRIMLLTLLAIVARPVALRGVARLLDDWKAEPDLKNVCLRTTGAAPAVSLGAPAR